MGQVAILDFLSSNYTPFPLFDLGFGTVVVLMNRHPFSDILRTATLIN